MPEDITECLSEISIRHENLVLRSILGHPSLTILDRMHYRLFILIVDSSQEASSLLSGQVKDPLQLIEEFFAQDAIDKLVFRYRLFRFFELQQEFQSLNLLFSGSRIYLHALFVVERESEIVLPEEFIHLPFSPIDVFHSDRIRGCYLRVWTQQLNQFIPSDPTVTHRHPTSEIEIQSDGM